MPGSSPRHQIQLPESPAKGNCQEAVTEFSSGECRSRKSQVKWLTADRGREGGRGEGREQQQILIRDMKGEMDKERMKKIQGEGAKKEP